MEGLFAQKEQAALIAVEYQSQRVLTTKQLAEKYGTDMQIISQNFLRNQDHYISNTHYVRLEGEALRQFKTGYPQFEDRLACVSTLYLWTEKGCFLHAKSLNTDQAWRVYEHLVEHYFRTKPQAVSSLSAIEVLQQAVGLLAEQERQTKLLQAQVTDLSTTVNDTHQAQHHLDRQFQSLKQGMVDINAPLRNQFNEAVRDLAVRAKLTFPGAYDQVYDVLDAQEHINIKLRAAHAGVRPVEILEKTDLLVKATRIAKAM